MRFIPFLVLVAFTLVASCSTFTSAEDSTQIKSLTTDSQREVPKEERRYLKETPTTADSTAADEERGFNMGSLKTPEWAKNLGAKITPAINNMKQKGADFAKSAQKTVVEKYAATRKFISEKGAATMKAMDKQDAKIQKAVDEKAKPALKAAVEKGGATKKAVFEKVAAAKDGIAKKFAAAKKAFIEKIAAAQKAAKEKYTTLLKTTTEKSEAAKKATTDSLHKATDAVKKNPAVMKVQKGVKDGMDAAKTKLKTLVEAVKKSNPGMSAQKILDKIRDKLKKKPKAE